VSARDDEHDEILRLRERLHKASDAIMVLQGDMGMLAMRVGIVEKWQARYEPIIEDVREADRIAEAVAQRLQEKTGEQLTATGMVWTKRQVRAAIVGVCIAVATLGVDIGLHFAG
jgi:hypothetical protein